MSPSGTRYSPADTLIAHENETRSLIERKDLNGFASYLAEGFYDIFLTVRSRQNRSGWSF